jgi:hypothetical protein
MFPSHEEPRSFTVIGPFCAFNLAVPDPPSSEIGPFVVSTLKVPLDSLSEIGPFNAFAVTVPLTSRSEIGPLCDSRSSDAPRGARTT